MGGVQAYIDLANRLSAFLDDHDNEEIKSQTGITNQCTPEYILLRLLCPWTEIRANLPLATSRGKGVGFRKIGFGQCGLVFERPGGRYVLKVARPGYQDALGSDCIAHLQVYEAFRAQTQLFECRIPAVYSYVTKSDTLWWQKHQKFFLEPHEAFPLPSTVLITERIPPLPKVARHALIHKFCPEHLKLAAMSEPSNRDCLARIYLGRRRVDNRQPPLSFTLRNFNLHLDQMLDLRLPVISYASAMASALATIHWDANIDGYDIEFVLGGEVYTTYTKDMGRHHG